METSVMSEYSANFLESAFLKSLDTGRDVQNEASHEFRSD